MISSRLSAQPSSGAGLSASEVSLKASSLYLASAFGGANSIGNEVARLVGSGPAAWRMRTSFTALESVNQPGGRAVECRLAIGWVLAFAGAKLLLHFLTIAFTPYEIHRDEFLYLAMGEHLKVWGMDFPPAIAFMARAARFVFGDTLFAVRFFPALAGTGIVLLGGLLARELGGGRVAQIIAMTALFSSPLFIRPAALFQPVVWDQLWWTLGFFATIKILKHGGLRWWVVLGVAGGFGLLTKFSILFFAFGIFVGVLFSDHRRLLKSPAAWIAVAIALVIGSPTVVGQISLHFPVVTHMTDLRNEQLKRVTAGDFLFGQVWMLGPALILALTGLVFLLRAQAFRAIGTACISAFLVLLILQGKAYYLGPVYPVLFAAGGVAIDRWQRPARVSVAVLTVVVLILGGGLSLPLGLPLLPPEAMARFCARVASKSAVTTNRGHTLALPQDYADMLGWQDQVRAVAGVFASLPADERAGAGLMARNYGEAGALEFYGRRFGLPSRLMLPKNDLLWPSDNSCRVVVSIGIPPADLRRFFGQVDVAAHFDHPWMVEEERDRVICISRNPIRDLREAWKRHSAAAEGRSEDRSNPGER